MDVEDTPSSSHSDEIITVVTPVCFVCGRDGMVTMLRTQFEAMRSGRLIQDACPDLHPADREQVISGTHPACWTSVFDR